MEELAKKLLEDINGWCIELYYLKDSKALEKADELVKDVSTFVEKLLTGNIYGLTDDEYINLENYTIEVIKDISDAIEHQDIVLLIDTLDFGLRSLLNIFVEEGVED